jgi:hypothetical protein
VSRRGTALLSFVVAAGCGAGGSKPVSTHRGSVAPVASTEVVSCERPVLTETNRSPTDTMDGFVVPPGFSVVARSSSMVDVFPLGETTLFVACMDPSSGCFAKIRGETVEMAPELSKGLPRFGDLDLTAPTPSPFPYEDSRPRESVPGKRVLDRIVGAFPDEAWLVARRSRIQPRYSIYDLYRWTRDRWRFFGTFPHARDFRALGDGRILVVSSDHFRTRVESVGGRRSRFIATTFDADDRPFVKVFHNGTAIVVSLDVGGDPYNCGPGRLHVSRWSKGEESFESLPGLWRADSRLAPSWVDAPSPDDVRVFGVSSGRPDVPYDPSGSPRLTDVRLRHDAGKWTVVSSGPAQETEVPGGPHEGVMPDPDDIADHPFWPSSPVHVERSRVFVAGVAGPLGWTLVDDRPGSRRPVGEVLVLSNERVKTPLSMGRPSSAPSSNVEAPFRPLDLAYDIGLGRARPSCRQACPRRSGLIDLPTVSVGEGGRDLPGGWTDDGRRTCDPFVYSIRLESRNGEMHVVRAGTPADGSCAVPEYVSAQFPSSRSVRAPALEEISTTFLGLDAGDLGGGLWWADPGSPHHEKIASAHVRAISRVGGDLVAIAGGERRSTGERTGSLLFLSHESSQWTVSGATVLPDEPLLVVQEPQGTLLVVSARGLVRVEDGRTIRSLYRQIHSRWRPSSIVKDEFGAFYIGTLDHVVKLTPVGSRYEERWLSPPAEVE